MTIQPRNIVFITHYFPPLNSSGAKRVEALSGLLADLGHNVSVITPRKHAGEGDFTEQFPSGVNVVEVDHFGKIASTKVETRTSNANQEHKKPSLVQRYKRQVRQVFGQIPDHRLPFAVSIASLWASTKIKNTLSEADVVIGSTPPWPSILATIIIKRRYKTLAILDYRDNFGDCYGQPGSRAAHWFEKVIDNWIARRADHLVTISQPMKEYYSQANENCSVILNGYDARQIEKASKSANIIADGKIRIRHMGHVSKGRIPTNFLDALRKFNSQFPEKAARLRFEYFGTAELLREKLQSDYSELQHLFFFNAPVRYLDSLKLMVEADYLIFSETSSTETLSAQSILTTKLFEYIGAERPIIADISPNTLAGSMLQKNSPRNVVGLDEQQFLTTLENDTFWTRPNNVPPNEDLKVTRQVQAKQYSDLIERLLTKSPQ